MVKKKEEFKYAAELENGSVCVGKCHGYHRTEHSHRFLTFNEETGLVERVIEIDKIDMKFLGGQLGEMEQDLAGEWIHDENYEDEEPHIMIGEVPYGDGDE